MIPFPSASIEDYIVQEWPFERAGEDIRELVSTISTWALAGNWLDLGCGPMLTVWPMFVDGNFGIWGCDRNREILTFHQDLSALNESNWPNGLRSAVDYANHIFPSNDGTSRAINTQDRLREIRIQDVLTFVPIWRSKFDTIVQIGCFGCLENRQDLDMAFGLVHEYLRPGGRFLSATWIPRITHLESETWGGTQLVRLSAGEFEDQLKSASLCCKKRITISLNDPNYSECYIFVAEKLEFA